MTWGYSPYMESSRQSKHTINPPVFFGSAAAIFFFVGCAALFPSQAEYLFTNLQNILTTNASWFYVAAVAVILISLTFIALSRYGDIKLSPDHAEPDFSFLSWFAMLFSAGMGIGLMFFGVSEPVMHFLEPPQGEPGTPVAAKQAMEIALFHWGLHAWATYAFVALILAFFGYRHGLPLTLRSALYPMIGDRIYGPIGHITDIFAIIGTTFSVATTLGYGVLQIGSGINHLFGVTPNTWMMVMLVVSITTVATLSVASGLNKGVRLLSELNLLLAIILIVMVVALGPTIQLLQLFLQNIGGYFSDLINKTFNLNAYQPTDWLGGWTVFYWAWWISGASYVGMFIARISRGRTIREFIFGVLLVPAGLTSIWMTAFGNTAINLIMHHGAQSLAQTAKSDVTLTLFTFLEYFPGGQILCGLAVVMIIIFFVTSADSAAMVIDTLASHPHDKRPVWQRVFWSCLIGTVALILMLVGGLKALQTATITIALPFAIILLISGYGLLKALAIDATKRECLAQSTPTPIPANISWQARLDNITRFPERNVVSRFMEANVLPAMQAVSDELRRRGVEASTHFDNSASPTLSVCHGDEQDFLYRVKPRPCQQPSFVGEDNDETKYYRAEVFLLEGGQDYDIMGWSRDQIISDVIDQYEKHIHFLHLVRE